MAVTVVAAIEAAALRVLREKELLPFSLLLLLLLLLLLELLLASELVCIPACTLLLLPFWRLTPALLIFFATILLRLLRLF